MSAATNRAMDTISMSAGAMSTPARAHPRARIVTGIDLRARYASMLRTANRAVIAKSSPTTESGMSCPSSPPRAYARDPDSLEYELDAQDTGTAPRLRLRIGGDGIHLIGQGVRAVDLPAPTVHAVQRKGYRVEDVPEVHEQRAHGYLGERR